MRSIALDAVAAVVVERTAHHPQHRDGPRVVASGNYATPLELLGAVDGALPTYRLHVLNAQPGIPARDGVTHSPTLAYIPSRLSLLPGLLTSVLAPDIVVIHCSRPVGGKVSLGVEVNVLPAAIESARARGGLVLAQLNPSMPYTYGDSELDVDLIDYAIDCDVPLASPVARDADATSSQIGLHVAAMIADGATLQLGIGAVPDSTLAGLLHRKGLRIWSEMIGDGVLRLEDAGALDHEAVIVASFMFGSADLYEWADHNPRVRLVRTERSNDPGLISKQPAMTSINSALQVDLFAQANASRLGSRIHSGFGGATDFLVGALHSPGGQAFIALRSWHPKAQVSSIVPLLEEPATSFQPTAIVTEQGVAAIHGHSEREQAAALIAHAAHPDVRDELADEARYLGLA